MELGNTVCPTCHGEGTVPFLRRPPDPQTEDDMTCPACHGEGVVAWEINVCDACDMPVESCRCDPEDFRDEAGQLHEPPSHSVRVAPLEDERKAA